MTHTHTELWLFEHSLKVLIQQDLRFINLNALSVYSQFLFLICLQSNCDGPKRIPVSHQSQAAVVTPTPHQRVLGVSNGPRRIQRPASHQKPASQVSAVVKSTHPTDQNVNPAAQAGHRAPQPKRVSQQIQPKTNVNPEPAKAPSEPANPDKPQSRRNTKSGK